MKSQYTQDVEFDSAFGALQAPTHLFTAASLCGFTAPSISGHFRYLDLACGNGLTLSLLADAYPQAEFVGFDINAAHIAGARETAEKAGLSNLIFLEADIADVDANDFTPFDYCAINGVYSWLDEGRRSKLRNFINRVVAPGGVVYLDYSSQPGMAQTAPLYQVLQRLGHSQSGSSAEKFVAATKFVDEVRENGARFFQQNPGASARLEGMIANPPTDEAHEVFNLQESGFWSADVIESMEQQGFSYVGSSGLQHNLRSFTEHSSLPASCAELPLAQRQMLQDVTWNVSQRKDLYIRNDYQNDGDLLQTLKGVAVYVAPGALNLDNRRQISKGYPGVDLCSPAAEILVESIKTAKTFGDIFEYLFARNVSRSESLTLVSNLLSARLLSVAVRPVPEVADLNDLYMPSKLNQLILAEEISNEHARPFTSPIAGSRVLLPIRDRLYLWAIVNGDVGEAWDKMGELRDAFRGENNEPLDRAGFTQVLSASQENFKKVAVPELLRLGILAVGNTSQ